MAQAGEEEVIRDSDEFAPFLWECGSTVTPFNADVAVWLRPGALLHLLYLHDVGRMDGATTVVSASVVFKPFRTTTWL